MGKFDSILNTEDEADVELTPAEALVAIAVIAGNVDTAVSKDGDASVENELIESIVASLGEEDDEFDVEATRTKITSTIADSGYAALYNAAWEALPDDMAGDAYGLSALVLSRIHISEPTRPY